ncbi:MAG TPA: hypothetical protein VGO47_14975 [Chlamydiales bacterium]|nr:hypothetical protein [Chlamydiales bacterium]
MTSIPPHPTKGIFQRGGNIKVVSNLFFSSIALTPTLKQIDLRFLHLDPIQLDVISQLCESGKYYHATLTDTLESQRSACDQLQLQGITVTGMGDLGNKWSRRWSKQWQAAGQTIERVLIQW